MAAPQYDVVSGEQYRYALTNFVSCPANIMFLYIWSDIWHLSLLAYCSRESRGATSTIARTGETGCSPACTYRIAGRNGWWSQPKANIEFCGWFLYQGKSLLLLYLILSLTYRFLWTLKEHRIEIRQTNKPMGSGCCSQSSGLVKWDTNISSCGYLWRISPRSPTLLLWCYRNASPESSASCNVTNHRRRNC